MANGDSTDYPQVPQPTYNMTFAISRVPIIGCVIDYLDIGFNYLSRRKSFTRAEMLRPKASNATLSATFLATVCLILGFVANVKFEVVKFDETPLDYDLHFMLMSKENNLYMDDIDPSRVMWCFEASDCVALLISCLLVWNSSNVRSPLSEYLFLPWLGVTLRGLILRQIPTVGALIYTMAVVDGEHLNLWFLSAFSFLFLLEARIALEIVHVLHARWERYNLASANNTRPNLETLWSDDDESRSIEVDNYVF